ncbi:unnamed protein product [Macrosiphum euphorbiae]|uniref:Uncharacterized protein n=1 Tax=Macrosiphum euphorbiae TaxID=13131 RepID=A0AAV0WZA1_9HEMI|nr:unnamed protein product [Macrosiphum euphorbiae]
MDSSNEEIDQQVLREAGEQTINAEWSATVSALNSSNTTSSNSYINIETLKECCANPSDTLKDKDDFMVIESSSTVVNISNFNDTKYYSECKTTVFQKKHKPLSQNVSRCFENILDDDSQMEITQNSICLNRFQKRKRLIPPNNEDFIKINNSNYSGSNSMEVSMMKSPKFNFSRKKKDQFEIPDYNLSASESDSIANETNISKRKENTSNCSIVVNDSSNNMKNASRTEVFTHKFSLKTIGVTDSVFENIINNSSIISDITLNNKKTLLNETALSNVNNSSFFSKMDSSNLNHTYDIPNNTNSTSVKASIAGDADIPKVKQNTVFKKPSNLSILVNDSSNNIMDVSKTEVLAQKFSRKSICVPDSAFDNIIDDSSMTSNIGLNNMKTSLNETSVSNINNSKMDMLHLNHTYDIPTNINTPKIDVIGEANIPKVKQNTDLKNPSNSSIVVNDSSNNIIDVSKTEVFTHKFSRKTIDVADSVFDNIINNSSIISDITLNHNHTFPNEQLVSNVNNSMLNKIDMSNLNHTYDIPTNINTSTIDVSITGDANIPKVKQNTDLKKPSNSSIVVNDSSNNIIDVSKTEVFTHKFSRKTIDVTHSVGNKDFSLSNTTTESLESNEFQTNQSKHSMSSTSSNEGLTLLNSTTGLLGSCSSSRTQSRLLTSKQSKSSTLNNGTLHLTIESLDKSQNDKSKHLISYTSNNEDLTLTNSTTRSSGRRSSSRNKSTSSEHSTSVISNHDSLPSLNATTEISIGGRSSRNRSKHSTSVVSNNDNLTLLYTTMESFNSNESQKTQSKRSISPTSYNESLKSTNSTTGSSGRRSSSRNKSSTSSKHSTSAISKNDGVTSLNDSKEISVGGRSLRNKSKHSTSVVSNNDNLTLLNTSMESLKSNESQKTQSKRLISPDSYDESLKPTNSTTGSQGRRTLSRNKLSSTSSKHSTSAISNNDSVTSLNDSKEISVGGRSLRNQSKHSTSVILNNDNLTLLNTTMESLKTKGSQKRQSKRSISPTSDNESLKSTNSTTVFSGGLSSSRNKSSLLTSKHSTSVISNSDSLTSLNATTEISVGRKSSKNQSQHSTSVISNHDSLPLFSAATMGLLESNESPKTQSTSPTSNIENLTTLNTTTKSLKQNVFSINESISKHSSLINGGKTSINALILGDVINNVSRMSTRSSKRKSNCSGNVEPITSIIIDGLSNSDGLTIKNTTTGPLEQKTLSLNQLNSSPNISKKTSTNGLILEDDTNNISKMYASSSKHKNKSYDDIEQIMPNITDFPLVEIRPPKTRVLRSSLHINKNKSLPTKSLTSENDVNNLSIGSTRTSKHMANFNNETFDNNSDNSLFWTTLPDESTNISNIQNVNMNTFQTPKRNKLSIAENIVNTIKIMSTNKQKSTHPGAFELDDHNDEPLTRSLVTRSRSFNRSRSILTAVFGGQKTSESTSLSTPSEIIFDQSQVEENVKQKFKSLYKKESWITKRLYKFLIIKLQPNYNIYSVKYAEKFVKYLAQLLKQILKDQVNLQLCTDMLRYHMARYHIIKDTFDYLGFLCDYIPMEYYKKLVPGWNLETSAVKFDPQKYYIPLMDYEEFLHYIMEHLNEA